MHTSITITSPHQIIKRREMIHWRACIQMRIANEVFILSELYYVQTGQSTSQIEKLSNREAEQAICSYQTTV